MVSPLQLSTHRYTGSWQPAIRFPFEKDKEMMPTIIVVLQRTDESLSSSEVAGWSEVTGSWCPWQTLCKGRVWEDTTLFS